MNEIVLGSVLFTGFVMVLASFVVAARAALLPATTIRITVNSSREIAARSGRKLLEILTDNAIPVPAPCGGKGTCGQCRVTVTDGAGAPLPTEINKLSRRDLNEGTRLSCQITVRNDLAVGVADDVLGARRLTCRVASSRTLSPLIRELVLELPEGETFEYTPGAYVQATAPAHSIHFADCNVEPEHEAVWERLGLRALTSQSAIPVARAYSIANRPADAGTIVLLIRLALPPPAVPNAPPGIVSSYLFGLKAGDDLDIAGPYGDFRAQATDREMVFIGGGVGMAPLRAIVFDQLERAKTDREISFWYGARSLGDLFYREEFEALAAAHGNFSFVPALSDPGKGERWDGATGFIHDVVLEHHLRDHRAPEACEFYLCGPPLMIDAVIAMLDEAGVEPESIFFDDFGV
ncbi:MAG: NADH:ubiquinone reductase (Na(+)-transporting) subunit F [Rhizobiaceae bacterium]|nr:NADH:ubiquinone reductase (Na(+)-transporting) subunit F [Rhizobiaceae bacterium]